MPTFTDNLPVWARPYAPTSDYANESFSVVPRLTSLTQVIPTALQSVQNEFSIKFVAANPTVDRQKVQTAFDNTGGIISRLFSNTIVVNKSVGFYGVRIDAKGYKKGEVQYMRQFPTDSFPLGVVSLDKSGRSIYSQKLQYGKQVVIASQILQLLSVASQLGQTGVFEELADLSLDAVNGKLYYPDISADVSFLTVYQSCIMTFDTIS